MIARSVIVSHTQNYTSRLCTRFWYTNQLTFSVSTMFAFLLYFVIFFIHDCVSLVGDVMEKNDGCDLSFVIGFVCLAFGG